MSFHVANGIILQKPYARQAKLRECVKRAGRGTETDFYLHQQGVFTKIISSLDNCCFILLEDMDIHS
jgi:hypothetical protein